MNFAKPCRPFGGHFDVEKKQHRYKEIEEMEALPGFWEDSDHAAKIQKEKAVLKTSLNLFDSLNERLEELEILLEYANEGDEDSKNQIPDILESLQKSFNEGEKQALLGEESDPNNAIISINAGAGGTESCDWAQMLFRMLTRWAESKSFKLKMIDEQAGDTAGIKSVTFFVEGPYAYGQLKSETGVHRLVRISPFDSNARRHTSFASVFVSPEIDDDIEIEINDSDLRIDVYRSGGAGGQSVNTTDSAVRITHHPSGIVVTCQNERSQLQNKQTAMKILRSRLFEKAMEEKRAEQAEVEAGKSEIGWGAQIRSYVLHPYKMVKDHRTNCESGNAQNVLDGDLDQFMKSYLEWNRLGETT